jgi:general stress protein 26
MDFNTLLDVTERILEGSRAAVLATVDEKGHPRTRWMVPAIMRGSRGALYAVTSPEFAKVAQIAANHSVSWLIQSKSLDEIVEIVGTAEVIENPSLQSDVMEALGRSLTTFWSTSAEPSDLVVLETTIRTINYFQPNDGTVSSATL